MRLSEDIVICVMSAVYEYTAEEIGEKLERKYKKQFSYGVLYMILERLEKRGVVIVTGEGGAQSPMKFRLVANLPPGRDFEKERKQGLIFA